MTVTGKQKAAMLLMSLDTVTATELLKGIDPETIQDLAVELAYLDAAGFRSNREGVELARQFYNSLQTGERLHVKSFLNEMLKSTVGKEKAHELQRQIQSLLKRRDPFITIRSANPQVIASVLAKERPQAIAVVLSELSPKKSSEVLALLGEGIRFSAISRMTSSDTISADAKARIAEMVCSRVEAAISGGEGRLYVGPEQSFRRVAVVLRNLGKELRDGLLTTIKEQDHDAGRKIISLMILWEDIPQISNRSLQEALRGIDSQKLALALVNAEKAIAEKIRFNISERVAAAIEEQTSFLSAAQKEDVLSARREIVSVLRELNEEGKLTFVEE